MSLPLLVLLTITWIAFGVALIRVDLREFRLPNRLVLGLLAFTILWLTAGSAIDNHWTALKRGFVALGIMVIFYGALYLLSRGEVGLGDVKLSAPIGMLAGYFGWSHVVMAVVVSSISGAFYGLMLLLFREANRRSSFAYGPFLIFGGWSVLLSAAINYR